MDDVIFDEFKSTGNMEINLDRRRAENLSETKTNEDFSGKSYFAYRLSSGPDKK